jgi:ankyrin repeat protein
MLDRIRNGRTDLVFEHLARDGRPDAQDSGGVPLIRWCAYYGDVSAVRRLVEAGASLSLLGDNLDLHGAAFHGHWQLCEYLIEQGADAAWPLPDTGETPLHASLTKANRLGQEQVVTVLLAAGADPNARTHPDIETGGFMRDVRTRGETALHRAAAFGSEALVAMLLDAGASPAARDSNGETPLSWASWHLRPSGVLRLLCFGEHRLHPNAEWTGDHGAGWSALDVNLVGRAPTLKPR